PPAAPGQGRRAARRLPRGGAPGHAGGGHHGRRRPARSGRHPAPGRGRQPPPRLRDRGRAPAQARLAAAAPPARQRFRRLGHQLGLRLPRGRQPERPAPVPARGVHPARGPGRRLRVRGADAHFRRARGRRGRGGGADRDPLRRLRTGPRVPQEPLPAGPRPVGDHLARGRPGLEARRRAGRVREDPPAPAGHRRLRRRSRRAAARRPRAAGHRGTCLMDDARTADVAILGGGLAGLTLALQLKQADPALAITLLERRDGPAPDAAFKVGESTVEIGAWYFAEVLGLRHHLEHEQIRKFGFRFFFSEGREDIDRCTEIGVSRLLPTPSWQIDRGRVENMLAGRARAAGIDLRGGTVVRGVSLADGDAPHQVAWSREGAAGTLQARWVVDASGRAGLLKRQLGLAEANGHDANAVWWRVDGFIDPNDWSDDPEWRARCTPPDRWRSTNHMCGPGYWFWLIPLASGAHSLGIVCDAAMHPLDTMNTHERAMAWLREHQPRVA